MNIVKESVSSSNDVETLHDEEVHSDSVEHCAPLMPSIQSNVADMDKTATVTDSAVANQDSELGKNNLPEGVKVLRNVASNAETISDCISISEDIKKLKHVQGRSNSTGRLYSSSRRVSFPEKDNELVTGYLEPADPWACVKPVTCVSELCELYRESCKRHHSKPIEIIMKHLDTLDLNSNTRRPILNLREQNLTAESCEALEEVLKRVQYKVIDVSDCGLDDVSATALFDMIEYYEATNELDISENRNITNRGWQACINMVKRSHALQILSTRGTPLSETNAISLGKSMLNSSLHTLKLEHCGLSGRPMASLCTYLRRNTVLKELWLAHNDLTSEDAYTIGIVLKANLFLQFLDISNNNIEDRGVLHITEALIEQANYFKTLHDTNPPVQSASKLQHMHMLTLTKGEKLQSLLRSHLHGREDDDTVQPTKTNEPNKAALPLIALFENNGNSNIPEEPLSPPPTPDAIKPKDEQVQEQTEKTEQIELTEQPKEEACAEASAEATESNSEDSEKSARTSVSTMSLESDKFSDVESSPQPQDNNNLFAENNEVIVSPTEEQVDTTAEKGTKIIDGIEEAAEVTTDTALDINDNKAANEDAKSDISIENVMHDQQPDGESEPKEAKEEEGLNITKNIANSQLNNDNTKILPETDLDDKVQNKVHIVKDEVNLKPLEMPASKPIQMNSSQNDENDDEDMSPLLKSRQPLNSPRLIKTKDIMGELPLTPDSSHSLDSSCEYSTSFEMKTFSPANAPERSFSSESLNSETSNDSNDSKSSIKLAAVKFSKNGTLERQISNDTTVPLPSSSNPTGLQVLMLWNNHISRNAGNSISDLLRSTTTLEILNVGKNMLSNDFISDVKNSLKTNSSLTSLGLQSAHLTSDGVKILSEVFDFGGNSTMQRIDLRDNNLQVSGLTTLNEVLKSNKSITRIDLDDVPRRHHDHGSDSSIDYSRVVNNIRSLCARNENPPEPEPVRTTVKRVRANFLNSRKISLTCQSIRNPVLEASTAKAERHLLDPARKSGGRLRSPLPSPIPSPVSSPIPSPSRSRFQVSRVTETGTPVTPPSSNGCSPTSFTPHSRFRVTVVEPPKLISAPVNIINSTTKEPSEIIVPKTTIEHKTPSKPAEPITTSLSVIDSVGNNSFDSPDLEVKAYMDDSCSSVSSLESIDRGNELNTSVSSMESYEILGEPKANDTLTSTVVSRPQPIMGADKTSSNSSIDSAESHKEESCASSLEASTCSNDSIYGSQEFPVLKVSSNEGTLTNSPSSPCCDDAATHEKECLEKPEDKRVRKTSWIGKGDGVYPATLDKLMSIFQHPSHLFFANRNANEVPKKENATGQDSKPPSRKESPMGGLFAWSKKENSPDESDNKVDAMPIKLMQEMKENISPEHTVTPTTVAIIQAQSLHNSPVATPHDKVRFEVGGNDEDDDDDLITNVSEEVNDDSVKLGQSTVCGSSPIRNPQIAVVGKTLGQITRDSLSILKGSSNNSQDSMRSLESLSEIVFEELPQ